LNKLQLLRGLCFFSRPQTIFLTICVIVAILLVGLGYNVNKLSDIDAELDVSSLNITRLDSVNVIVTNPSLIPFKIQPFSLSLKVKSGYSIAQIHCSDVTRVSSLSRANLSLHVQLEDSLKLREITRIISGLALKGVIIEGEISAEAFGIQSTKNLRKEYALFPM